MAVKSVPIVFIITTTFSQTKFLVTGGLVALHGLIGAYGCVMKQSRCLILYGCLGFCLLILGSWQSLSTFSSGFIPICSAIIQCMHMITPITGPVAGWMAYLNGPRVADEGGKIFEESYYNQTAANRTDKENELLKVTKPVNLRGGGSKAHFFGGSDLSFGHHRCP